MEEASTTVTVWVAVVVVVESAVVVVKKERVVVVVVLAGAAAEVDVSVVVAVDCERYEISSFSSGVTLIWGVSSVRLTVMVLVATGRVVKTVFVAGYVLVLVVFATMRAPQITVWGY